MNILFLTRRFYPDIGGVEKHIHEISKILTKKGYRVTVITESQGKIDKLDGISIVRTPAFSDGWTKKFSIWFWFLKNLKYLKSSDVIHAHDVFYWYLPFKFLFLSKKCFITFHGYESYPISKKAILLRKIWEILSNGNIIVGDFINKWYHTNPDAVIYGGVNIPKVNIKVKNKKSAVFFGRLDYHTGVLDYAKAVDLVRKKVPEFDFTIVGEGEDSKKLRKYKLIGFQQDINRYLYENNFAFVSRYLSILEALAQKRLVIAHFDNPVKEDYLRMAPFSKFIIIEDSAEKMAERISYFLKNPNESEKLIEKGYTWVKDRSWDNVVKTYLKLWNE